MSNTPKPLSLQILLGITLSVLAVVLIAVKLNSADSGDGRTVIPVTAPPTVGRSSQDSASRKDQVRKSQRTSSETPLVPATSVEAASSARHNAEPSDAATAFHQGRAKLLQDHQQLMLQLAHATPEEQNQSMEKWHEEHADELAAQQQLAIRMGAESRPPKLSVPSSPNIPSNATPEFREFLTTRHAVMKDQTEMMNQLQHASPDELHQAMEKWHEQNASRLEAMQAAASRHSESQPPPRLPGR